MRIATYNVEWFSALFDQTDTLLLDHEPSRRRKITRTEQIEAIAEVFRKVDADITMIIEAPNSGHVQSTIRALERFATHFRLRQRRAVIGFANGTEQEIAALYDPDRLEVRHDPRGALNDTGSDDPAPRFDGTFRLDVDVDAQPDLHRFSKPPLELEVTAGGKALRLIGVHAKSKAPHGARNADEVTQISIANRRKQLAQCVWLRGRVEEHLTADEPVIVLGDLNDGPGLDAYEKLFGRSSIEVVLGPADPPGHHLVDPHASARLNPRQGWFVSTARFYNREFRSYVNALLDYVMLSPDLARSTNAKWTIWHPFDHPACFADEKLSRALLTASDHFPVSVDLNWPA